MSKFNPCLCLLPTLFHGLLLAFFSLVAHAYTARRHFIGAFQERARSHPRKAKSQTRTHTRTRTSTGTKAPNPRHKEKRLAFFAVWRPCLSVERYPLGLKLLRGTFTFYANTLAFWGASRNLPHTTPLETKDFW